VIIQSGKVLVRSLSIVARFLRISEYVISFALIAFATSLPELSVGINSAILGIPELSLGDIIGTNIVNFCLVLGIVAIVGKKIELKDYAHFKSNRLFQMVAVLAPLILMFDGTLSRTDGYILIVLFVWNLLRLFDIDDKILGRKVLRPHLIKYAHARATTWKQFITHVLLLLVGAGFLLAATLFLVKSVENISHGINVSEALIGVLIIAVATSVPDLIVGLRSVVKHKGGMALGDVFGAATINATLTLGIVAIISPFSIENRSIVWVATIFTFTALLLIFYFLKSKHSISRKEGSILFGLYILFVITELSIYFF
jgi:cation:H+ antiporter